MPDGKNTTGTTMEGLGTGTTKIPSTQSHPNDGRPPKTASQWPRTVAKRLPIVLGVMIAACSVITTSTLGLRWMAQHGGGTGNPVEASSDIDNTPIPAPHVSGIGMMNLTFPSGMTTRMSMDGQQAEWDGTKLTGELQSEVANKSDAMVTIAFTSQSTGDMVIEFSDAPQEAAMSFSISMFTRENGLLMLTGSIGQLPSEGIATISPTECRIGITDAPEGEDADEANPSPDATEGTDPAPDDPHAGEDADTPEVSQAPPTIDSTVSYTVGDGNPDYDGSYISCSTSLSLGKGATEAYLTANTRRIDISSPSGLGTGCVLQAGCTTIRKNGMQSNIAGTKLLEDFTSEFSETYDTIAKSDESETIRNQNESQDGEHGGQNEGDDESEGLASQNTQNPHADQSEPTSATEDDAGE